MCWNNLKVSRQALPIALIPFLLFAVILASGIPVIAQMHMGMDGAMDMDMGMYKALPLSGCEDYHCLKCKNRDYCSTGGQCGMPNCGHDHASVECHGCSVLYLRSASGFSSCLDRAQKVVNTMNSAMALENPEKWHYVVREGTSGPEIWLEMKGIRHGNKVVSVTKADMIGYRYRAGVIRMSHPKEVINQRFVAKWWAALLQDHFDAMILGKQPSLTVHTHCGKPLLKAYQAARKQVAEGPISMGGWKKVFSEVLSPTDRDRLGLAAQIIPKSFAP